MTLRHLRSSTADKRPQASGMAEGQLAINTASGSPGLFFKGSAGNLVKVGPVHVGSGAPNASPASGGTAGNSLGEQWLDTSGGTYVFKVWDGAAWRSEAGEFVNTTGDTMTGALGIIAGSASTPGLFFSGDANSGLYSPGADQVAISTNSVGRLFVDASGRVGVGGNPSYLLDCRATSTPTIRVLETTNGPDGRFLASASDVQIGTYGGSPFCIYTNSTEKVRVTTAGLVGVGTSSPSTRLHVRSSADDSTPIIRAQSNNQTQHVDLGFYYINYDNGATSSPLEFQIDGSTRMALSATGLGVGTTSLAYKFEVKAADDGTVRLGNSSETGHGSHDVRVVAGGSFYNNLLNVGSSVQFHTFNGSSVGERLRIDSSGRVGIGTSSASTNVEINAALDTGASLGLNEGQLSIGREANSGGAVRIGYDTTNNFGFISSGRVGTSWDRLILNAGGGNVGIGTTAMPADTNLTVLGNYQSGFYRNVSSGGRAYVINIGATSPSGFIDGASITGGVEGGDASGSLLFGTRTSGTVTEKVRLDSSGRLLVGTSTSRNVGAANERLIQVESSTGGGGISVVRNSNDTVGGRLVLAKSRGTSVGSNTVVQNGDDLGGLIFAGADGSDLQSWGAQILAEVDGTPGVDDLPTRLVFSVTSDGASSPTERMRITNSGQIWFNKTSNSFGATGIQFRPGTSDSWFTTDATNVVALNRLTNDGTLLEFAQDSVVEGSISVSGTTVSYNGAHLSRWSQLPSGAERTEILRGTVLSNIDEMCEWGDEDNEQLNRMKVSDVEGDKNVSGVFQAWDDDDDTYTNDFYCAMTGDFIIRISAGVTVERGDLLMSAGDGTAKPQDDDIIRSKTIAKVTSTNVSCTYDDGSYCVPCVLMAC